MIGLTFCFFSCKKNTVVPNTTTQNIITTDSSHVTGQLTVRVKDVTGLVREADVLVFLNKEDARDSLSLFSLKTNSMGEAYFGFLLYNNYYIKSYKNNKSSPLRVIQVIPSKHNYEDLYL